MLYLWTVQSKQVLKRLLEDGQYYPDFNKSSGYGDMKQTYPGLLESFNHLNQSTFRGFIFCFYRENGIDSTSNCEFKTVDDVYDYLVDNLAVTAAFNFWSKDYAIVQIEANSQFNIMPMDFNDVIKLSMGKTNDIERVLNLYWALDPEMAIAKFNHDIFNIINFMNDGKENPYTAHRSFLEGHYPYLVLSDIKGVYPNLNFRATEETGDMVLFDLPYEAQQLSAIVNNRMRT